MSATLNDSTINHWDEVGGLIHHVPLTSAEIQEFDNISCELAKLSSKSFIKEKQQLR